MTAQMDKQDLARVLADGFDSSGRTYDLESQRNLLCEYLDAAGSTFNERVPAAKQLELLARVQSGEEKPYLEFSTPWGYRDSFALSRTSAQGATELELVSESYADDGTIVKSSCKPAHTS